MHSAPSPTPDSLALLRELIRFDTTSRNSNLELIDFVREYLTALGVETVLVHDPDQPKANLYATIGDPARAGLVLSGHTDVVPVDGQDWHSDPYTLTERDGRLYGRGTADMKGFIAVCLAAVPAIGARNLDVPVHLALSYDEEIGCVGVRGLLAELERRAVRPRACVIGEPTGMRIIRAHKGKLSQRCTVHGLECHSGMTHRGVNAVEAAAETIAYLKTLARGLRDAGPFDTEFDPPYTTVHTGVVHGGTALNIVPKECRFDFEFRHLPDDDPEALLEQVRGYAESRLLPEMRAVFPGARFEWELLSQFPGLSTDPDAPVTELLKAVLETRDTGKVSFGTEGGLFQRAGIPAIVCGPGDIDQAHKPDEFIDPAQLSRCEQFIARLIDRFAETG